MDQPMLDQETVELKLQRKLQKISSCEEVEAMLVSIETEASSIVGNII
jgi:hypothetical protein